MEVTHYHCVGVICDFVCSGVCFMNLGALCFSVQMFRSEVGILDPTPSGPGRFHANRKGMCTFKKQDVCPRLFLSCYDKIV